MINPCRIWLAIFVAFVLLIFGMQVIKRVTSINFYGKIIDQTGAPVAQAQIEYSPMGDPFNPRGISPPRIHGESDALGRFSLLNFNGVVSTVSVSKVGYYWIEGKSSLDGWGRAPNSIRETPPTLNDPAIFVLWKKGIIEPLIKKDLDLKIDPKGTPLEVNMLYDNDPVYLKIELVSEVISIDNRIPLRPYNWSCKISIPDGGLQERLDLYLTMAPEGNYRKSISINVSKSDLKWKSSWKNNYFIHLSGNFYGRILVEVQANQGVDPRVRIVSYVNPKEGSKHLDSVDEVPFDY